MGFSQDLVLLYLIDLRGFLKPRGMRLYVTPKSLPITPTVRNNMCANSHHFYESTYKTPQDDEITRGLFRYNLFC